MPKDINRRASRAIGDFFIVIAIIWIVFVAFKALFLASQQTASLLRPSDAACPAEHPCRPSRPAEHPCRPFSASGAPLQALSASGAPLHRPSRPAEHSCRPFSASGAPLQAILGQRSTPAPALSASGAPLGANFNSLPASAICFCENINLL
ncbi:uncharacterized protein LOC127565204 [Drosophila albomicans]|uniref:Uncharacterized protein LOC127565204 n=1 Tax=Drosophila albomicans TaxID=7291 RepID=A0A9C6SZG4_DROAB|nr:uncharacterized protein LOC127565204 [Drosophila albomicans]